MADKVHDPAPPLPPQPVTKTDVLIAAARGEGCLGRAADDEPVIVLRAHDHIAPHVALDWVVKAKHAGVSTEKVAAMLEQITRMLRWQGQHGSKVPD